MGLPFQEVVGLPRLVSAGQVEVQESTGACRSRTNADDRLAPDPLDRVEGRDGVIEGRDIGSVVFPDAELKLFLTAATEVRAQRRHKEVVDLAYEEVAASIAERDALDQGRKHAPLTETDDAIVIDTTGRTVDDIAAGELVQRLPRDVGDLPAQPLDRFWGEGRIDQPAQPQVIGRRDHGEAMLGGLTVILILGQGR